MASIKNSGPKRQLTAGTWALIASVALFSFNFWSTLSGVIEFVSFFGWLVDNIGAVNQWIWEYLLRILHIDFRFTKDQSNFLSAVFLAAFPWLLTLFTAKYRPPIAKLIIPERLKAPFVFVVPTSLWMTGFFLSINTEVDSGPVIAIQVPTAAVWIFGVFWLRRTGYPQSTVDHLARLGLWQITGVFLVGALYMVSKLLNWIISMAPPFPT